MSTLRFPKFDGSVKQRYYSAYYASVIRSASQAGINVILGRDDEIWCGGSLNAYSCTLNEKRFIMDFSDLETFQLNPQQYECPYFKWQFNRYRSEHVGTPNVYPLCILMDFDWNEFVKVRRDVEYKAIRNTIRNQQRPRAAAKSRRLRVQKTLKDRYGTNAYTEFVGQRDWWLSMNDCFVSVHVPGARNDMLDRGQWELMGLGVCVISPKINTVTAAGVMRHAEHYVAINNDYSDLIETIEWCREHREKCRAIGERAKRLFDDIAPPKKYWRYVEDVLNERQDKRLHNDQRSH